jgi:hypothetical protein
MQNEDNTFRLAGKIDDLSTQVTKLNNHVRSLNTINPTTTTLQKYIRSANEVVQSAASVVSSRSTVHGGSVAGSIIVPLLPESKRERIAAWLHEPIVEERELSPSSNIGSDDATEYTGYDQLPSRAGGGGGTRVYDDIETRQSSVGDPNTQPGKFDFEITVLDNLQKSAVSKFSAQDYKEARNVFELFKEKSQERYSSDTEKTFPFRDQTLEHLGVCYIHLWDWGSAEQLLTEHFMGRQKVLDMLVGRYIHHKKFNEALTLLLHERDMHAVRRGGRPGFGSSKILAEGKAAAAQLCHLLAEVYLGLGQFDNAKLECRNAAMEKVALWGNDNVSYHMSISLLGEIFEMSGEVGDSSEAEIYRDMVPEGIEGNKHPLYYLTVHY